MYRWTEDDHNLVQLLTAQGLTVAQIASETGLSVGGIKRSRTVSRSSKDNRLTEDILVATEPKLTEVILGYPDEVIQRLTEDNQRLVEDNRWLKDQVSDLITQLKEVKEWVDRKKRAEAKERDYAPPTTGFQLKRAGTI